MNHEKIKIIKCNYCNELLKKKNVISVGVGYKVKNKQRTNEKCLAIGVIRKSESKLLNKEDIIPSEIDGVKTDVVELGHIKAQADEEIDPTEELRPLRPGISIGNKLITAGTLGLIVKKNGVPMILSNNHVLSDNQDTVKDIVQPGIYDGGSEVVAYLEDFIPIYFEGQNEQPPNPPKDDCFLSDIFVNLVNKFLKLLKRKTRIKKIIKQNSNVNTVDCAIAKPIIPVSNNIIMIGDPIRINVAGIGQLIKKYGRTTRFTEGEVLQTDATIQVDYGNGRLATFEDQIIASAMSQGGDSGSAVLNKNNEVIGLLFAGSSSVTILNPIQEVFNKLGVNL